MTRKKKIATLKNKSKVKSKVKTEKSTKKSVKKVAKKKVTKKKVAKTTSKSKNIQKKYDLVVVESPSKAKTIRKYLGPGYMVTASNGHIKDLPKSKLGVDVSKAFP